MKHLDRGPFAKYNPRWIMDDTSHSFHKFHRLDIQRPIEGAEKNPGP